MAYEDIRLDTALYIGIAIDVLLAIVAAVVIYKWRKRANQKEERSRQGMYAANQRVGSVTASTDSTPPTTTPTPTPTPTPTVATAATASNTNIARPHSYVNVTSPGVDQESENVEGENVEGVAFLNNHASRSVDASPNNNNLRRSRVNFSDDTPQELQYPSHSAQGVVQNPLSASTGSVVRDEGPESQHNDTSLSTYYTYNPPSKHLDGESSEIISDGERSQTSSLPAPPTLDLSGDDQYDVEGQGSSLPPPPDRPGHEYTYIDNDLQNKPNSWSTVNFGEDDVYKFYKIEFEESTPIL